MTLLSPFFFACNLPQSEMLLRLDDWFIHEIRKGSLWNAGRLRVIRDWLLAAAAAVTRYVMQLAHDSVSQSDG